jgi:hypothetical protein
MWVSKINDAIASGSIQNLKAVLQDLVKMRETGLVSAGEFSTENLVFKILRQSGIIEKLKDVIINIRRKKLSVRERNTDSN